MTLKTRIFMASAVATLGAVAGMGGLISLAAAAVTPSVNAVVQNSSNTTITSALTGSTVHAQVTIVPPSTGPTATGTVDFNLYSNQSCSGSPLTQNGVALIDASASSSGALLGSAGLSFKVHYNGNNDYSAADSACASVSATQASTAISLSLSNTNVQAGSSVFATPNLTGETGTASGTLQYRVYSNNNCSTLALNAGSKTVTNGSTPNSDSWQFITPGTYYWQVGYSGDQNNAAATSSCNLAGTVLTVVATSSTPTTTPPIAGTISGTVFNDLNKDDMQNGGEAGLSGWTVWLHKASTASTTPWWMRWFKKHDAYNDPIVATATTDSNGNYSFSNLGSGQYFVEENVMSGWKQTSSDTKVMLTTTHTSQDVDFANIMKNATSTKHGGNGDGDGENNDDATTTNHDNGNHNGWFKFNFNGNVFGWLHLSKK